MTIDHDQLKADVAAGTPGPWRYEALGGSSTVLAVQMPSRNDTRMPAYAYREENGFCLSYPFVELDGQTRWDFTCFSHADARRIARLPDLESAYLAATARADRAEAELAALRASLPGIRDRVYVICRAIAGSRDHDEDNGDDIRRLIEECRIRALGDAS